MRGGQKGEKGDTYAHKSIASYSELIERMKARKKKSNRKRLKDVTNRGKAPLILACPINTSL